MRLLILAALVSGCAAQPTFVTNPLPLPVRPVLETVSDSELECLSDDAYERLVLRDMKRRQFAEELEAVIISTHPKDEQ